MGSYPSSQLISSQTLPQRPFLFSFSLYFFYFFSVFFMPVAAKQLQMFPAWHWAKREDVWWVHRSSRIFWRNKLAAWLFGAVPRLLGSNPAPWEDKGLDATSDPL